MITLFLSGPCWRPRHPSAIDSCVKYNKSIPIVLREGTHTAPGWLTATLATTRTAFLRCSGRREPCVVQLASFLHTYLSLYKAGEILWPTSHSLNPNP